jgi:hypothetical protein
LPHSRPLLPSKISGAAFAAEIFEIKESQNLADKPLSVLLFFIKRYLRRIADFTSWCRLPTLLLGVGCADKLRKTAYAFCHTHARSPCSLFLIFFIFIDN